MKPNYGNYHVTKCGRVFSFKNKKWLKPFPQHKGYLLVDVFLNKKRNTKTIHRLVAEIHISNPESQPQVNHINGIKTDNRVENLEWCDGFHNMKHAYKTKLKVNPRGEQHPNSKLNEKQVLEIKKLLSQNIRGVDIARQFNTTTHTICDINRGKTWKHV